MMTQIRIATRKSALAMWQAEHVKQQLEQHFPDVAVTLLPMITKGDKILAVPLAKVGGKGLFVKELEQGILEGRADIAVHSIKDVPMELPPGLHMPVVLEREDPFDAFVSHIYSTLDGLPPGAKLGTSSLRRQCQLLAWRPDLQMRDLRGNVGTRLDKLKRGAYDAIILAKAGLKRLGHGAAITQGIQAERIIPAVGQGAIGIECRKDAVMINEMLAALNHNPSWIRISAERAFNHKLNGGCQVPIAGFAELEHGVIVMRGLVGRPDGGQIVHGSISGKPEDADELGQGLAEDLLARGAGKILQDLGLAG